MSRLVSKARTALKLGLLNLVRVVSYRLGVRSGMHPVRRIRAPVPTGPFFQPGMRGGHSAPASAEPVLLFSRWPVADAGDPPDWLADPLTGTRVARAEEPWWLIPDFDPAVGDIKRIWELSRLDWAPGLARSARSGGVEAGERLERWVADWARRNPPYCGPNWKCGQEASIRVMNLAMAALIMGQDSQPTRGMLDLVEVHLKRIAPTIQYAVAQDNNHGTSEAAALFIGGSWLAGHGRRGGRAWERAGRRWLEERVARLVGPDGGFSQYSLNYHRLMLDTLCMSEVWRRRLGRDSFSAEWRERARAATEWLRHMINPWNGDGPNVGANDGARLLQITDASYRDHRPTVQLAAALFLDQSAYVDGPWNEGLSLLGVEVPATRSPPVGSRVADDAGFAVLTRGDAKAMLRYPRFRFRPSQADALHLDLWVGDENLLRDGGSCSYADGRALEYFAGVGSHNTIQFDGRDQMPRLSRFLFGDWLRTSILEPLSETDSVVTFGAAYRDGAGSAHMRRVRLEADRMSVSDDVSGFGRSAVLRWRLAPGDWRLQDGCRLVCGERTISLSATVPIVRCELVEGQESRHYLEQTSLPVLEVEVAAPCVLTTQVRWRT
tara:strand:+ start:7002 stop:8825 length:1824 start_codon:yes stop_codon:yes gene_type:complete